VHGNKYAKNVVINTIGDDIVMTKINRDENTLLREWYVRDLTKPEIDKFERATILRAAIIDSGLSIRGFGEKYGINKSTVEDWLLYNRISEQEYNKLVASGVSPKSIYKTLRGDKKNLPSLEKIDIELLEMKNKIYAMRNQTPTHKTPQLIQELVNQLNEFHSNIILKNKKGVTKT